MSNLFLFDHIWAFLLRAPSSRDAPTITNSALQVHATDTQGRTFDSSRENAKLQKQKVTKTSIKASKEFDSFLPQLF